MKEAILFGTLKYIDAIKKWLLLMKLITFFFFLGIFQVSASV